MSRKQDVEVDLVRRLLEALRVPHFTLEPRDKPDVLATINKRHIGIEVTVFHNDEESNSKGGSQQRKAEEQINRNVKGRPYAMWVGAKPLPGLVERIRDKVKCTQSYNKGGFNELWLLIAASIPQMGAACATFITPIALNPEDLNNATDDTLRDSLFARAYLHVTMGQCLYEWSRHGKWQVLQAPEEEPQGSELRFKKILRDPEWLRNPRGKARAEAMKALEELRAKR